MRGRINMGRGQGFGRGQGSGGTQKRGPNRGTGVRIRQRARDGSGRGRVSRPRQEQAKGQMTRVAVSSTAGDLNIEISDVFGRCPYFIYADISAGEIKGTEARKNTLITGKSSVGIAAAREIAEMKADALITSNIGPKAFDVLHQLDIKVYKASGTVRDALNKLMTDGLERFEWEGERI